MSGPPTVVEKERECLALRPLSRSSASTWSSDSCREGARVLGPDSCREGARVPGPLAVVEKQREHLVYRQL